MSISLRINVVKTNAVRTMQFDGKSRAYDVCKEIREKLGEEDATDHGLFWPDEDPKKGRWLEDARTLEYYDMKTGDLLEYKKKHRPLRVKMMDGAMKMVLVDDSLCVGELLKTVCEKVGITNTEEFSFIAEEDEAAAAGDTDTMTRAKGKKGTTQRGEKKMAEIRAKQHTDDKVNWLNHDKSLREQGVDETQVLLLKKKFFFSDRNVDRNDPVQLNLLYVQSRDGILQGVHKCTEDEAVQFAAMQCQVQHRDHAPDKHKPGFLDPLKDYLPPEYAKTKTIEKKILQEHRKLAGLSELNAKYRYIQLCRSLATYGVTCFLVKEKVAGKNKLVPRLLGITRDSIMRMNEQTKEVMKVWPLTQVRRWAASPKSFTLDFGDYSEAFYSVQTTEGDAISRLVSGYIDIILQKKKDSDRGVPDDGDGSLMVEDNIGAVRATAVHHLPSNLGFAQEVGVAYGGVIRPGMPGYAGQGQAGVQALQYGTQGAAGHGAGLDPAAQKLYEATRDNLNRGITTAEAAKQDLVTAATLPPLGNDPASVAWRQQTMDVNTTAVQSQLAAMTAATASVLTLTSGDPADTNYTAVGSSVTTVSSNLQQLAKGTKMIAALMPDKGKSDKLLAAARELAGATKNMLSNVPQPGQESSRADLLKSATQIGASAAEMQQIMGDPEVDAATQEEIMALAKAVANATTKLVSEAKTVAGKCPDSNHQAKVINSAKGAAMSTQEVVACTKVVVSCINSPLCQDQLIEAANIVSERVKTLQAAGKEGCQDAGAVGAMDGSAEQVAAALAALIAKIREGGKKKNQLSDYEQAVETILATTDDLFNSMGDAASMVKHAKTLATATAQLVNCIKTEAAKETDPAAKNRLLEAAKLLAQCTTNMVDAAKNAAKSPNDPEAQARLKAAATALRNATNQAAAAAVRKKLLRQLEDVSKQTAACSTQLISAAQGAGGSNRNQASQQQLLNQSKQVTDKISDLVLAARAYSAAPENPSHQLQLITASKGILQPAAKLIAASKAAIPTVGDASSSMQLQNNAKATALSLAELKNATLAAAEACGNLEIDAAIDIVKQIGNDIQQAKQSAAAGQLLPLPGETQESCAMELGATSKSVGSSMAQLLTAANQGNRNYTSIAARDTAGALKVLGGAVRGVAATTDDKDTQNKILDSAKQVMDVSAELIGVAKKAVETGQSTPASQKEMQAVAKKVSQALNEVINCLPGQRDVDAAMKTIQLSVAQLNKPGDFPTGGSFADLQSELNNHGSTLTASSAKLMEAARGSPEDLAKGARAYEQAFKNFMDTGMRVAGATKDPKARADLVNDLKQISQMSAKMLLAAKNMNADPTAPNVKQNLQGAHSALTAAVSNLLNSSTSAAPGQRECDQAIAAIQSAATQLNNPDTPLNDQSYHECLTKIMSDAQALNAHMATIKNANGDGEKLGVAVQSLSKAVCALAENTAQATYVVGASDPSSTAGTAGLIDQASFARAAQAITQACDELLNPANSQQQILSSATVIAKHTSALCAACKTAATKTNNPVARQHFNTNAKNLAQTTGALVKSIKALATAPSEENRAACKATTEPLVEAVNALVSYASSPEFATVPANISEEAREHQKPLVNSGKGMCDSVVHLIQTTKGVAGNPGDTSQTQMLAANSKAVGEAIRSLVSAIQQSSPGSRDVDQAIQQIQEALNVVDKAGLDAMLGGLAPNGANTIQGFQDQVRSSLQELHDGGNPLIAAAKGDPEKLGHAVHRVASQFAGLAASVVGAASKMPDKGRQANLLDRCKTVCESALALMYATRGAGGDAKATTAHQEVDDTGRDYMEAVSDLIATIEGAAGEANAINNVISTVQKAVASLDAPEAPDTGGRSYQEFQEKISDEAKNMIHRLAGVSSNAKGNPEELAKATRELGMTFESICSNGRCAVFTTSKDQKGNLRKSIEGLGVATVGYLEGVKRVQENPKDLEAIKNMTSVMKQVTDNLSGMLAAAAAGSQGIQACDDAVRAIDALVSDLEAAAMFASMGQLNPADKGDNFARHKEAILTAAKTMVADTKELVKGAASTQEELAKSAAAALATTTKLAESCKRGAASIGANDKDAQELMANSAKSVASAMQDLISTTKKASGKAPTDPSMEALKDNAKNMVQTISTLLKTVKSVDDESARGARALEGAMEAIKAEVKNIDSPEPPKKTATSEEVVKAANDVTKAMQMVVAASNMGGKQDAVTAAANQARKAVTDLITLGRGAAHDAPDHDLLLKTHDAVRTAGDTAHDLLGSALTNVVNQTPETKKELLAQSKKVAESLNDVITVAHSLKGEDWVDPNDPNVIAEQELLAAAASIEAAARKLAELKPRESKAIDENLNFDEQILEAAKSIAAATSMLVKSATQTQKELVATGAVSTQQGTTAYRQDSEWRDGLVSAAKAVAASTGALCDAANLAVQGEATEEKLVAAARSVSASTTSLLVAAQVKADSKSQAQARLQAAGRSVKKATDSLVTAASNSEALAEEEVQLSESAHRNFAVELEMQESVLKAEADLAKARKKLEAMRKDKYKQ